MRKLDLRNVPCPLNSSRALIYLSTLESGEVVEILVDDGEPISNVPHSLDVEGHKTLSTIQAPDSYWIITVVAN